VFDYILCFYIRILQRIIYMHVIYFVAIHSVYNGWETGWKDNDLYLLTHLLTHSMVQSPSWAANWFAASQEIPRISRNPNVHYRTHKRPPTVSIQGQPNPVHIPTSHLLQIRLQCPKYIQSITAVCDTSSVWYRPDETWWHMRRKQI
jgi:hypothetical protein